MPMCKAMSFDINHLSKRFTASNPCSTATNRKAYMLIYRCLHPKQQWIRYISLRRRFKGEASSSRVNHRAIEQRGQHTDGSQCWGKGYTLQRVTARCIAFVTVSRCGECRIWTWAHSIANALGIHLAGFHGDKQVRVSKRSPPVSKLGGQLLCCTARRLPVSAQMCVPVMSIWCQAMRFFTSREKCKVSVSVQNSQRTVKTALWYVDGTYLSVYLRSVPIYTCHVVKLWND